MPLPELIEIQPISGPVGARITVPGSKSLTNRALILAALADGPVTLEGALWSEDTEIMAACLSQLGFGIEAAPDPEEPGNRNLTVTGLGGRIPRGGTAAVPLELFVGNAGTVARFIAALVCLGPGVYRLRGVPRMHERPQAALFRALRGLGYQVDSPNDKLPAVIYGGGPRAGTCRVSIEDSSQFASGLLLGARAGGWTVTVEGTNLEESPYVRMTTQLLEIFPHQGGRFAVEPDASSGSYFWAAGWLLPGSDITVQGWPRSGWQIDAEFTRYWPLPPTLSREGQLGDSILTAMVLAPFATRPTTFIRLGRLRVQECERVRAMRTELARCGARVREHNDTLEIEPSILAGAEIETYSDHRLAMAFATLGLKVPGIRIQNPACVRKTFPNFFQKLHAPPPAGLGATIRHGRTGHPIEGVNELL